MNWNKWVRQIHRWLSIAFTVTVIANFIALARQGTPPPWVTYSPLLPLALLLFTGLVLVRAAVFRQVAQPATRRLNGRPHGERPLAAR